MNAPARLYTAKELAAVIGLSENHLQRRTTRQRLEANGCPAPIMARPLRWSVPAVERWIKGGDAIAAPHILIPALDEGRETEGRETWRGRLTEKYGAQK